MERLWTSVGDLHMRGSSKLDETSARSLVAGVF